MNWNTFDKISLFLQCRNLPKMDLMSHTDGFAVIYLQDHSSELKKIAHTSVIADTENPQWVDEIAVDYVFEAIQTIVVRVYDQDGGASQDDLSKHDYIGEASFLLSQLMTLRSHRLTVPLLLNGAARGELIVYGETVAHTSDIFTVNVGCRRLVNVGSAFGRLFTSASPFYEIERATPDGDWVKVWQSAVIPTNLSPNWGQLHIPIATLCNGSRERPLRFSVRAHCSSGRHILIGTATTTVADLVKQKGLTLNLIDETKAKSRGYINSGMMLLSSPTVIEKFSLSDYITGGCEVSLMVAVDFSASNGDPRESSSLHFIHPQSSPFRADVPLNPYQKVMISVGSVLEQYDSDKKFPFFGFGAKLRQFNGSFGAVQPCFPILSTTGQAEVVGVQGLLESYSGCFNPNVMLSGPTVLAPLLETIGKVTSEMNCRQDHQRYAVLLIITDGAVNDLDRTIRTLIDISSLPLSIVIVGVGDEDFSDMVALDSDDKLLKMDGKVAQRDIVQFIPFSKFEHKSYRELAQEVLAEIPRQLLEYMNIQKIEPNPPTYVSPTPTYLSAAAATMTAGEAYASSVTSASPTAFSGDSSSSSSSSSVVGGETAAVDTSVLEYSNRSTRGVGVGVGVSPGHIDVQVPDEPAMKQDADLQQEIREEEEAVGVEVEVEVEVGEEEVQRNVHQEQQEQEGTAEAVSTETD